MVANPKPPAPPLERTPVAPQEDAIVVLDGATWADFERVLAIKGERQHPRVAYSDGRLQLMSPSINHEVLKSMIGRLIEAWCFERDVEFTAAGAWSLKNAPKEKGLEPDECYLVGDNASRAAEADRPDLAIEVVWTSGGIDKLVIYAALGVREVWSWKGGSIRLYELRDGEYVEIARSGVLAGIDHARLAACLEEPTTSKAIRRYRAALAEDATESA